MTVRYSTQDQDLLKTLVEYRAICVRHLTILHKRNTRALRRRLLCLQQEGLIEVGSRGLGDGRGRPEHVLSLTQAGVSRLKTEGALADTVDWEQVTVKGLRNVEHQLLMSEFRVQCVQACRLVPSLSARFLSAPSLLRTMPADNQQWGHERIPADDGLIGQNIDFVPDGVLAITDSESKKSVLFFLEVDMGTECLISSRGSGKDVRQKILNYQAFFRGRYYARYEKLFGAALRGFRLLFLANNTPRMLGLCQLASQTLPSGFIWLADRGAMLSQGLWAPIWVKGGHHNASRHSILGSRAPSPSPLPADL